MKYMDFQIVFNISKVKKTCKLIGQIHFWVQLEKEVLKFFWQNHKSNYGVSFNTQKGTHWWINFFSKSILLIYFRALFEKLDSFPEIQAICYFRALTTPKKNFILKLQLPWISYYMQKTNFLPQIVFEILKF